MIKPPVWNFTINCYKYQGYFLHFTELIVSDTCMSNWFKFEYSNNLSNNLQVYFPVLWITKKKIFAVNICRSRTGTALRHSGSLFFKFIKQRRLLFYSYLYYIWQYNLWIMFNSTNNCLLFDTVRFWRVNQM